MAVTPDEKIYYTGDLLDFGHYEQDNDLTDGFEPITWQVLDVQDGKAFLVSLYALDAVSYSSYTNNYYWELSPMRNFLNDDFLLGAFTKEERRAILLTKIDNTKAQNENTMIKSNGPDTEDKIFLMSYTEAE